MCLCPKCGHYFRLPADPEGVPGDATGPVRVETSAPPAPGVQGQGEALPPLLTGEVEPEEPFTERETAPEPRGPLPDWNTSVATGPPESPDAWDVEGLWPEERPAQETARGGSAKRHRLSFHGRSVALLKIHLVNTLLTLVTLGVYRFWGKVKMRKYLCGATELMGERFVFTGTGKELFAGWRKAAVIIFFAFMLPDILSRVVHPSINLISLPAAAVIVPFATVASRRYRLSRTNWHGVRFSFAGSPREYINLVVKGTLLNILTLGFHSPAFHVKKQSFWRENTFYGTSPGRYGGDGADLKGPYRKALLLSIPTLGLYWFWYKAELMRYDWEKTTFEGLSFSSNVTGGRLLGYTAGNVMLLLFSLGFAYPWVLARSIRFTSGHLKMTGEIDFGKLGQAGPGEGATGEGLAGILDLDLAM